MAIANDYIVILTRAQAIADGALIDVSDTAREAGLRFPTAVTSRLWAECVAVPDGVPCQDEAGRLWDVLWMLRVAALRASKGVGEIRYRLHVRNDNRPGDPPLVEVKAVCGPDEMGQPTLTVMMPDED